MELNNIENELWVECNNDELSMIDGGAIPLWAAAAIVGGVAVRVCVTSFVVGCIYECVLGE